MTKDIELPDVDATERLGENLARVLPAGPGNCLILLQGELGAGKSSLARAMIRALGHTGTVPSPTYTLIEPYQFDNRQLYHTDLYRIADPEELEYLGWSDLQGAILLVEWPERAPELFQVADLHIKMDFSNGGRKAHIVPLSPLGDSMVDALAVF
ncbi:MAG TPA: tRNA (adenosine(37)-N6)-threonylcarbamoyltransferase complex ATPase subunit type 1 TsaE [Woeseiaceae bacterium]